MKAKRKSDGAIIDVEVIFDEMYDGNAYVIDKAGDKYFLQDLDFTLSEPEEEVRIEGWVAIDEAYDACFLHTSKPHQVSQEIADTGDYNTVWESDGKTYLLDTGLFPDMDCDSEPVECKVTITIKPKRKCK